MKTKIGTEATLILIAMSLTSPAMASSTSNGGEQTLANYCQVLLADEAQSLKKLQSQWEAYLRRPLERQLNVLRSFQKQYVTGELRTLLRACKSSEDPKSCSDGMESLVAAVNHAQIEHPHLLTVDVEDSWFLPAWLVHKRIQRNIIEPYPFSSMRSKTITLCTEVQNWRTHCTSGNSTGSCGPEMTSMIPVCSTLDPITGKIKGATIADALELAQKVEDQGLRRSLTKLDPGFKNLVRLFQKTNREVALPLVKKEHPMCNDLLAPGNTAPEAGAVAKGAFKATSIEVPSNAASSSTSHAEMAH